MFLLLLLCFSLLYHAGNEEVHGMLKGDNWLYGKSENLIEISIRNGKVSDPQSWEGSCIKCWKNLVGGVGIFCGIFHKTRVTTSMSNDVVRNLPQRAR